MKHKRALLVAAIAAVAAVAAAGGGIALLRPDPTSGLENGRFEADCCGTLELRDGEMVLNDRQSVRYQVGRDAEGPYLLPRTYYVGGIDAYGFEVDGTRPVMKLRLDRMPGPATIRLPADGPDFLLKRELPRPAPPRSLSGTDPRLRAHPPPGRSAKRAVRAH
jgi:hypothetical protein